jgi:hypothetical protein
MDQVCDFCKAIPFHELPSENEPGFPHQPSFRALKTSANNCSLCSLILMAANDCRKRINSNDSGEWREFFSKKLPSGKSVSEVTIMGAYAPGLGMRSGRPGVAPTPKEPPFPFKDDASVRPWLYGNWWALDANPNVGSQLIGMGVRLGTGPEPEAAEGNTKDQVLYRGSQLRLRTDDCTFSFYDEHMPSSLSS